MIIQENPTTKALYVQIPKALAIAKGIKKGDDATFILNKNGEILLSLNA